MDTKNGKHLTVSCHFCLKQMRSDNLKRHIENKHEEEMEADWSKVLEASQDVYYKKVQFGHHIYKSIKSKEIDQIALSEDEVSCLKVYTTHRPVIDVENVVLKPWQQKAMELLQNPTDRKVIWIRGQHGNEGKTWFQAYAQSLLGFQNVGLLDLKCKTNDSLLLLSKQPLVNMDKFLFNDVRATSVETEPCYNLLEMIKDGRAVSSKYNTNILQFWTPNVVMVFSNQYPEVSQLSMDRWMIYNIKEEGLEALTNERIFKIWKSQCISKSKIVKRK